MLKSIEYTTYINYYYSWTSNLVHDLQMSELSLFIDIIVSNELHSTDQSRGFLEATNTSTDSNCSQFTAPYKNISNFSLVAKISLSEAA